MHKLAQALLAIFTICGMVSSVSAQGMLFGRAASGEDLLLPAPRSITRMLSEGRSALAERRYADGINALYAILQDPKPAGEDVGQLGGLAIQDYLEPNSEGTTYRQGIRKAADNILSLMSEECRETLQLQFGVTAQQALERALESGDASDLAWVARNFPHTEASYDAFAALAMRAISEGRPIEAALHLSRLISYPQARRRFGPELLRTAAIVWHVAGRDSRAVQLLSIGKDWFPGQSIQMDGRQIALDSDEDWTRLLDNASELDMIASLGAPKTKDWTVAGGGAGRNAVSVTGMPIPTRRWSKDIHANVIELGGLINQRESLARDGNVLLPKFELRIADNLVFTKTTDDAILAIDFETGLLRWPMYRQPAPVQFEDSSMFGDSRMIGDLPIEIRNRVWGSSAFGQFSCDMDYVYAVRESQSSAASRGRMQESNFLVAYSNRNEGSFVWTVGQSFDSASNDPASLNPLSDAFFLGPPLPYGDDLYVLAEIRSLLELVVLDRHTGEVKWRQQLATVGFPGASQNPERSSQALSPTISDGVAICPTALGMVAAVDLTTRSLRWANIYPVESSRQGGPVGRSAFGGHDPLASNWQDPRVIAGEGYAAVTPPESNRLLAFDIADGSPMLANVRRQQARYVAGIRNGEVIAVAERQIIGYSLQSDQVRMGAAFPDNATLAGRGIWMGDELLLPLSGKQAAKVDVSTGRVVDKATVDGELGNLFAYKNQLLSVSDTEVIAYFTREAIEDGLNGSQVNASEDLNRQALLALADGKPEKAVDFLRSALELSPRNRESKYLLAEALLAGLSSDYEYFRPIAEANETIIDDDQRFQFLQKMVEGDIRSQEYLAACERLLQMMDKRLPATFAPTNGQETSFAVTPEHRVDYDVWIQAKLSLAYSAATPQQRRRVDSVIRQRLADASGQMVFNRKRQLTYFAGLPSAREAAFKLAADLQKLGEFTSAEQVLLQLRSALKAELETVAGNQQAADLDKLAEEHLERTEVMLANKPDAEIEFLGPRGRYAAESVLAGEESIASLRAEEVQQTAEWPSGSMVRDYAVAQHYQYGAIVDQQGERFGRQPVRVARDNNQVILYNAIGEMVARVDYNRGTGDDVLAFSRAKVRGGLIILETLTEVAAFDLQRALQQRRDAMLWRQSLRSQTTGAYDPADVDSSPTPLGFPFMARKMPGNQPAEVGPLTVAGLPLQVGNRLIMLDPLTGHTRWERNDVPEQVQILAEGAQLALVEQVNNTCGVRILDVNDGSELSRYVRQGERYRWASYGRWLVDYMPRYDGSGNTLENPVDVVVWDVFKREVQLKLNLAVGSRGNICEGQYVAIVDPTGVLHSIDLSLLDDLKVGYQKFEVQANPSLDTVGVRRFANRLVVLSNSSDRSLPIRASELFDGSSIAIMDVPVHGFVYCVDLESRQLCWDEAGELLNMKIPKIQSHESPYLVAYFDNKVSRIINLAVIDLRTGLLAYAVRHRPSKETDGFASVAEPLLGELSVDIGTENFRFRATDLPLTPQPIVSFTSR